MCLNELFTIISITCIQKIGWTLCFMNFINWMLRRKKTEPEFWNHNQKENEFWIPISQFPNLVKFHLYLTTTKTGYVHHPSLCLHPPPRRLPLWGLHWACASSAYSGRCWFLSAAGGYGVCVRRSSAWTLPRLIYLAAPSTDFPSSCAIDYQGLAACQLHTHTQTKQNH